MCTSFCGFSLNVCVWNIDTGIPYQILSTACNIKGNGLEKNTCVFSEARDASAEAGGRRVRWRGDVIVQDVHGDSRAEVEKGTVDLNLEGYGR